MPMIPTARPRGFFHPTEFTEQLVLAINLQTAGRLEEAKAIYEKLLSFGPSRYDIMSLYGSVLAALGQNEEALRVLSSSLRLAPDQPNAHNVRGGCLLRLERTEEALESFDAAIIQGCDLAHWPRGRALTDLGRWEEALDAFDIALRVEPNNHEIFRDRVRALLAQRRYHEALASLDRALALCPDFPEADYIKAEVLLMQGDYENGWRLLERRENMQEAQPFARNFNVPRLQPGSPVESATILVHSEQGYGDTLQFCRFVPRLLSMGAKVVLEVWPSMRDLMTTLHPSIIVIARDTNTLTIDYHCPIMSIPYVLRLGETDIPISIPYLRADHERAARWAVKLQESSSIRPRVGLVWFGSMGCGIAKLKSMAYEDIEILTHLDADFFSLQKLTGTPDEQESQISGTITKLGGDLGDFAETAAVMANLDLIITVDTAAAHLAGALGRPVWILLPRSPEWRWPDSSITPWYPSARLFRQSVAGDWSTPLEDVRSALSHWIAARE